MRQKKYKSYKTIDFLPMWNYYKALETDDLRYLLKDIDYEELPDIDIDLTDVWNDINYQVADIDKAINSKSEILFNKRKLISEEQFKYYMVKTLLSALRHGEDEELQNELAELGYKFNKNKPFVDEWIRINKRSENIKVGIQLKQNELNNSYKKGKKTNIESTIDDIERYTNKSIDAHKLSTKRWFVLLNKVIDETTKKQMSNG